MFDLGQAVRGDARQTAVRRGRDLHVCVVAVIQLEHIPPQRFAPGSDSVRPHSRPEVRALDLVVADQIGGVSAQRQDRTRARWSQNGV
eukprot:3437519-Rhodomonas_salina.1